MIVGGVLSEAKALRKTLRGILVIMGSAYVPIVVHEIL